jgi:hypothetical protein
MLPPDGDGRLGSVPLTSDDSPFIKAWPASAADNSARGKQKPPKE